MELGAPKLVGVMDLQVRTTCPIFTVIEQPEGTAPECRAVLTQSFWRSHGQVQVYQNRQLPSPGKQLRSLKLSNQ
jgi:hypothetical protein